MKSVVGKPLTNNTTTRLDELCEVFADCFKCEGRGTANVSCYIPEKIKEFIDKFVITSEFYVSRSDFIRTAVRNQLERDLSFMDILDPLSKSDPIADYMKTNGYKTIRRLEVH